MTSNEPQLVLVRHGLTDFDVVGPTGRFLGRLDPPLNERGVQEAQRLRGVLLNVPFDRAFTNAYRRCRDTLAFILSGRDVPTVVDPLMDEIDYGKWDGLTKAEVATQHLSAWQRFEENPAVEVPPGGESGESCARRARHWLSQVDCDCGLAVVDKTWLRLLLATVTGIPLARHRDVIDTKIAGISVLRLRSRGWRIEAINYAATARRVLGVAEGTGTV